MCRCRYCTGENIGKKQKHVDRAEDKTCAKRVIVQSSDGAGTLLSSSSSCLRRVETELRRFVDRFVHQNKPREIRFYKSWWLPGSDKDVRRYIYMYKTTTITAATLRRITAYTQSSLYSPRVQPSNVYIYIVYGACTRLYGSHSSRARGKKNHHASRANAVYNIYVSKSIKRKTHYIIYFTTAESLFERLSNTYKRNTFGGKSGGLSAFCRHRNQPNRVCYRLFCQ